MKIDTIHLARRRSYGAIIYFGLLEGISRDWSGQSSQRRRSGQVEAASGLYIEKEQRPLAVLGGWR